MIVRMGGPPRSHRGHGRDQDQVHGEGSRSRYLLCQLLCQLLCRCPQDRGEAQGPGTKPGSQTERRVASVSHDASGFTVVTAAPWCGDCTQVGRRGQGSEGLSALSA